MNRNAESQEREVVLCPACRRVPISYLSLDLVEPIAGWSAFLAERDVEIAPDDLGRPSVRCEVLGELLTEQQEWESRLAERPLPESPPVGGGVPAGEGLSAFESMAARDDYRSLRDEVGRPPPRFLEEELAEGQRRARAEAEAAEKAWRVLDGRDK